ncbi:MAG: hypothetical protein JXR67_11590 [Bacteroidales bacterium]|nr:hypothetical protein [Bacteroidales bacterium]
MKRLLFLFLIIILPLKVTSQELPHPVVNTGVYEFLDELASMQIIEINSAVKPYSRLYIANKLNEADQQREMLNSRQQKELDFYLMDFGKELLLFSHDRTTARPQDRRTFLWHEGEEDTSNGKTFKLRRDLFYYKDSLFSLTINPILGGEVFFNSDGRATYARNFGEARAYIGKWGFWASLRDNHEKPLLGRPQYLTKREGGHVKGATDWSEMQAGITRSWSWGYAGFVKDRQQWGSNYNGANIFGGNNPTFFAFKLNLKPVKWFEFNYFHGWLNSMVVDSSRSYWVSNSYGLDYREVYHKKYIAANMFTFTPVRNLNISAGNSIVYTDKHFSPVYMFPLFFYKSVDHSYTSGVDNMNSQTFIDISSRNIRNLHLYATLFIDELSVARFTRDDEWNFFSWKAGFRLSNLPFQNLSFTTEFTYSYPLSYQHYVPTLTYDTQDFNLGHYLRDNSKEWYFAVGYKPIRTLNISAWFTDAVRGPDYTKLGTPRVGNPPLASVEWQSRIFGLRASYQVINDLYTWCSFSVSEVTGDERWSPEYFYGQKNTINLGATFGF